MEALSVAPLSHSSRTRLSHRLVGAILLFFVMSRFTLWICVLICVILIFLSAAGRVFIY